MAVVANENRIKILATDDGLRLFQTTEEQSVDASREISETLRKVSILNSRYFFSEKVFLCFESFVESFSFLMLVTLRNLLLTRIQLWVMLNPRKEISARCELREPCIS